MRYEALRGFNYRDKRFEVGQEVVDISTQEIEALIKEGIVRDMSPPSFTLVEEEEVID